MTAVDEQAKARSASGAALTVMAVAQFLATLFLTGRLPNEALIADAEPETAAA